MRPSPPHAPGGGGRGSTGVGGERLRPPLDGARGLAVRRLPPQGRGSVWAGRCGELLRAVLREEVLEAMLGARRRGRPPRASVGALRGARSASAQPCLKTEV